MKALVLGAYGLIGAATVRALRLDGFDVCGMGRSDIAAQRAAPDIDWIIADIATQSVDDWKGHLQGVEVVINASGALQDGARDNLQKIHEDAIAALCDAAKGLDLRFIQISAAGADMGATTEFMRSKARGDALLQKSDLDWTILRPALVIGQNAYGGTALLRGVAGLPAIGPRIFEDSPIQTIALTELAEAIVLCAKGNMPSRCIYELSESAQHSFGDTVDEMRSWLGFAPFLFRVPVPRPAIWLTSQMADAAGWLGWRSPLRSNAVKTLAGGVTADLAVWQNAGGPAFGSLRQTLGNMPATQQERWFARLFLMLPLSIVVLSVFWLLSGLIGFWQFQSAANVLTTRGFSTALAGGFVGLGSVADIALGLAVLFRPWARHACLAMVLLSLCYLAGASLFAADLWADPLGPMVKVLPSMALAIVACAMLEER